MSLDIKKGEIVSLLGKSGSGKTTLLNIIAGFEKSDSGVMSLNESIVFDKKRFLQPQKRDIGFVFQNYALFPHMSVYENITFGIDTMPKKQKDETVKEFLKLINLSGYESRYPHQLSGGQQQRIALVRAMALHPELILLDEPFSSIDTMAKAHIQKQLLEILKKSGQTAVLVTHDAKEAMAMSDKIIYLEAGRIIQYDTPENIYSYPKTKSVATTFGQADFIQKQGASYCIRPQHCKIVQKGTKEAKIKSQLFQGSCFLVEVEIGAGSLHLYSDEYISQEYVSVAIDWQKCHKM